MEKMSEMEMLVPQTQPKRRKISVLAMVISIVVVLAIIIAVVPSVLLTRSKNTVPQENVPLDDIPDYGRATQAKVPEATWKYILGQAGAQVTYTQNSEEFNKIFLVPRALTKVGVPDYSLNIFGKTASFPIFIDPVAKLGGFHPDGEAGVARAAKRLGIPMAVSYLTTTPLEVIAKAWNEQERDEGVTAEGGLWMQVYLQKNRTSMEAVIRLAEELGFDALLWTIDSSGSFVDVGVQRNFVLPPGIEMQYHDVHDYVYDWEVFEYLKNLTSMKMILKGLVSPESAREAVNHGVDGIIVSNLGGRQIDTIIPSIKALPEIVEATKGSNVTIMLDSGIRRGTDVFKALSLGASAVLVGRPMVWGLSMDGSDGVHTVMSILRDELHNTMGTCGCATLDAVRAYDNIRYQ